MKTYLKYLLSLLLFGSNGIVASYILLNSYEIVLTRTLIGGIFLITVFLFSKEKIQGWKSKKRLICLMLSGAAMGASWIFVFEAYAQIGVSTATLVYYCGPVIVMILSPLLFHERVTAAKGIGVISVLFGMFFVNFNDLSQGSISWGLICGILSAFMYAAMVIFNKMATGISGLENAVWQLISGFLTVSIFTLITRGPVVPDVSQSLIPVLYLGIVNTGIGCYLYFSSIQKLPVQSVAICSYLDPLSALIFSAILLQERLSLLQIIGAFLILGGAAFGELGFTRKRAAY